MFSLGLVEAEIDRIHSPAQVLSFICMLQPGEKVHSAHLNPVSDA